MRHWLFFISIFFISCQSNTVDEHEQAPLNEDKVVFEEGQHILWKFTYDREEKELTIIAHLADGWMTYSTYNQNFMGPLPTLITFDKNALYELDGSLVEENLKMKLDEETNEELSYFEKKAIFKQKLIINSGEKFVVTGNVNFMTCNENGCEPPVDYPFEIEILP